MSGSTNLHKQKTVELAEGSILEQAIAATKQTERSQAEELLKELRMNKLKGK